MIWAECIGNLLVRLMMIVGILIFIAWLFVYADFVGLKKYRENHPN